MKVLDAGHTYSLRSLDGGDHELLRFVKREGPGFPGNKGHHPGTTIQEVLRACIDRLRYVDNQIHHPNNPSAILNLQRAIWLLEVRAAERHERSLDLPIVGIENEPTCPLCGHIGCPDIQ